MMRTLFLHPPSYEGFDGGAGSRYQAKREVRSFWYPTWLAQPAALVPDSKLVDAPAAGLSLQQVLTLAKDYELAVLHTSSPSFPGDVKVAEALKRENPNLMIGFVGAKVAVEPDKSLLASPVIDRTKPGLRSAVTAMISNSSNAVAAVVGPTPIRSMTGPWTSEPTG